MGGHKRIVLGSLLLAAAVGLGFVVGRVTGHGGASPSVAATAERDDPSSRRFSGTLTDTTPSAAPAAEPSAAAPGDESPATIVAVPPLPIAAPKPAPAAPAAVKAQADAGAPAAATITPASTEPPAAAPPPPAAPMTPTEFALSLRHQTDQLAITHSSFDEDDVTEHHPVSDHPVTGSAFDQQDRAGASRDLTRSSFDDDDSVDRHPTGP
ncbi:MAG TPA: hypothetical protein VGL59_04445 [Polyangia bacterium]|jgi:hypothetical protein